VSGRSSDTLSARRTTAIASTRIDTRGSLAQIVEQAECMPTRKPPHPLELHPSFRAVIAAATPIAELAFRVRTKDAPSDATEMVGTLAMVCGDLADGFAAPVDSRRRRLAHHRAWIAVREVDRAVGAFSRQRLAPVEVVRRAQRAIDRADVLVGALLPY
jgi:hypothetical protein